MRWATLPHYQHKEDVPLPAGWTAHRTEDLSEQLPIGVRRDTKSCGPKGGVPVIDQSEDGVLGWHDDQPGVEASESRPVVTFANHTCEMRLNRRPFSVIQNVFPKVGREPICSTRFFYYATKGRVRLTDYKGHHPIFRAAWIPVPPPHVQSGIVEALSAYDDLIENCERRIRVLDGMARALYREWFVDFRYPGHEKVPMVESPLGPIPREWKIMSLGDVANNFDRLRRPLSKAQRALRSGPHPYYGAAKIFDYIDDFIFDGEYLLFAEDGSVSTGEGGPVLQLVSGKFWPNNHTHILQGRAPVSTFSLYLALASVSISQYVTGAAQPKVTQENMNRIPLLQAPAVVHAEFDAKARPLFLGGQVLQREIVALRETRDLLLPRLLSGELLLKDHA